MREYACIRLTIDGIIRCYSELHYPFENKQKKLYKRQKVQVKK